MKLKLMIIGTVLNNVLNLDCTKYFPHGMTVFNISSTEPNSLHYWLGKPEVQEGCPSKFAFCPV